MASRKNVRVDSDNKDSIRCPGCGSWSGHFVSKDVPSSLLQQKSVATKASAEVGVDKTEPEKSLDDYVRLLKKSKDAEVLKVGLANLAMAGKSGSDVKFEDLLKFMALDRLNKSDNPTAAISSIQSDLRDLKRDIVDAKKSVPTPPGVPPYLTKPLIKLRRLS